jgi:hypothetical protein
LPAVSHHFENRNVIMSFWFLLRHQHREHLMHRLKILAAAVAMLAAAPVVAQEIEVSPGPGPGARYYNGYDDGYYRNYRREEFWPGQVAGDVVGGAIGTAGAIATAPFRALDGNPSYAMGPDMTYCAQRYRSFDPASGTFMGYDGRRHPCQ